MQNRRISEQELNEKNEATIRRCGEYDLVAPQEIRDQLRRILLWELYKPVYCYKKKRKKSKKIKERGWR